MTQQATLLPLIARIEHRAAEAAFVREIRAAAAGHSVLREDLRFFIIAYVAALIVFLSWLG